MIISVLVTEKGMLPSQVSHHRNLWMARYMYRHRDLYGKELRAAFSFDFYLFPTLLEDTYQIPPRQDF